VPHDEPKRPDLRDAPTQLDLHHALTLLDLHQQKRPHFPAPKWPIPLDREQRPAAPARSSQRWLLAIALGASAALLLSIFSLLAVIGLTNHTGLFAPRGSTGPSAPAPSTASPTASAAPASGWLQVAPATVQFGCSDHQRTQIVVLENHGTGPVHWQASLSVPADRAGMAISPGDGDLGAGESTAIQLQSTSRSARQQIVISFDATDAQAGPPASVSFSAVGCN
jgi:hypothetical protein